MNGTERETQTWYVASKLDDHGRIEQKSVVHVTEKTVSYVSPGAIRPIRAAKDTAWDRWFEDEQSAVEFQRERLTDGLEYTRERVAKREAALAAFNEAHPLPATEE